MLNNNFNFQVHNSRHDENGNYLCLDITVEGERFTLVTLYGPNEDNPHFYSKLFLEIEKLENKKM